MWDSCEIAPVISLENVLLLKVPLGWPTPAGPQGSRKLTFPSDCSAFSHEQVLGLTPGLPTGQAPLPYLGGRVYLELWGGCSSCLEEN